MGIPKFFRYISERYPLTSQLIEENKIPEFDNLYVDFNGIIHNCSHPNDGDAHFRLSEEQIFTSIFTYVDHLFGKIKPKKLFFMAVDGVAPRAKMNQQRSRRFRTAKEAKELKEKAERKGEKLPEEKAFDSNCITPGTPFMKKLSEQLRYFVNKKISEDANWREVEVVLSGHEVPGEGEHKIMEYIRLSKAQPDYNPNVRHCLYGLDADLIMLGLLSHDPHFCLLREEVKFGPAARKKGNQSLESTNFFLLHLCLLREYLDLEFSSIAPTLPFQYNLERIIDDFILIAVFVGNDFLPNLPNIHIHTNGLELLFEIYKRVLPKGDGYLNESGVINMKRLQLVLDELSTVEIDDFHKEHGDSNWMKGKQRKYDQGSVPKKGSLALNKSQQAIFQKVQNFVLSHRAKPDSTETSLRILNDLSAGDRQFITTLAQDLNLSLAWDEFDDQGRNLISVSFPYTEPDEVLEGEEDGEGEWEDDVDTQESNAAIDRVLTKYSKAKVLNGGAEEFEKREEERLTKMMDDWKREYYRDKLELSYDDPAQIGDLVYEYLEGMQWVMHYYYSGVASWSWFYSYHYAPRISDLKGAANMSFSFDLSKPFRPFEQLMGVLPEASKEHLPPAYWDLMYDQNSPIIDFYPEDFELDMNGKKAEWEAIVKIPFIDQERLLKAMASREHRLTAEEKQRNGIGTSTRFVYSPDSVSVYPSSLPGFFPAITRCLCLMEPFDLPTLDGLHLVEGLCDGVQLGVEALAGFPSLHTLPHTAQLEHHGVNVFQAESKNQSMVIMIENTYDGTKTEEIARLMVGKRTFIGWPFLTEGLVVAVSDELFRHEKRPFGNGQEKVMGDPHSPADITNWRRRTSRIEDTYSKRFAVITGQVEILLHVRPLRGLKRLDTGALVKDYEDADKEMEQAVQLGLMDVVSEDPRFLEKDAPPLSEEFPEGSRVFFLGEHAYGAAAQVSATTDTSISVILAFFPQEKAENEKFTRVVASKTSARYLPSYKVSDMLGMSGLTLAKITSSLMVVSSDGQKSNLGLSLKFEARGMKVLDYSRKQGRSWEFSDKAVELIKEYRNAFPELFRRLDSRKDDLSQATDFFDGDADAKVKEIRNWLVQKGVRDFEPVTLYTDQLKKETVAEIERLADSFNANKSPSTIKKAMVKGIPRQAVLKPSHAVYRLQNQSFALGDRVTMVQDSGGVPLCAKGVVVSINHKSMDVVWDIPFMSGTTLGDRCSQYRGSSTPFNSCLNLTNMQFVTSTNPQAQPSRPPQQPFVPRLGPLPAVRPRGGLPPQGGFRQAQAQTAMHIMRNPNRPPQQTRPFAQAHRPNQSSGPPPAVETTNEPSPAAVEAEAPAPSSSSTTQQAHVPTGPRGRGGHSFRGPHPPHQFPHHHPGRGRGADTHVRGGTPFGGRGRGFAAPQPFRGRGGPRGGFNPRGRGRIEGAAPTVPVVQ